MKQDHATRTPAGSQQEASRALAIPKGLAALVALCLLPGTAGVADDTALFTAVVPPNVMLMIDNSGSMNNLVWHPDFDPSVDPSCAQWNNDTTYSFTGNLTMTACGNTRTLFSDTLIDNRTRIDGRYLNWFFSDESDAFVSDIYNLNNGTHSSCLVGLGYPTTYTKYRRSRVTAARQVLRDVICQVNAVGDVRFGLAQFYRGDDPQGGHVKVPIEDFSPLHAAALDLSIDELEGETWTPLAETLYNVYRYFQSRSTPATGKDGATTFPAYDLDLAGNTATGSLVPDSPVEYDCQKNFVVLITDGEPTRDDFDGMGPTTFRNNLVGDYNPDNALPEAGDEDWESDCSFCRETSWYLDDLAMYMAENDFQEDFDGDQTIDVYTVGFTTQLLANQLLQKTANVGNGLFRLSNNAEELVSAIVTILTDVIEKSQSFTAATVPASRATDGNNFYASYFLPSSDSAYWEGHVKNFEFNKAGQILDANGNCALDDPNPARCELGALKTNEDGFWDALDEVPAAGLRKLFVSNYQSAPPLSVPILAPEFTRNTLSPLDLVSGSELLGVAPNSTADFPPNSASNDDELRDRIVDYVRGCEWDSSPCADRPKKLWDIFHSNPLLIGSPNAGHADPSYRLFAKKYKLRRRVLYAGSNGGFVHGFDAGDWDTSLDPDGFNRGTGTEMMGFMTYPARQKVKELAKDKPSPKTYLMDGQLQAADVWLPPSATAIPNAADEWHTLLVGTMRQGGDVIYALDITDPPDPNYPNGRNSTLPFPAYMWEFPCEADHVKCKGFGSFKYADYMGESWSDPVITKIRARVGSNDNNGEGFDRWVAIFGGGYDEAGDPNVATSYDGSSDSQTSRRGRAIFMVDVATGELIAMKRFDHSPLNGEPAMRFAMPSAPSVFDLNFDGYADVVYIGDLGGNLWKWVIHDFASIPSSGTVGNDTEIQQSQWAFTRLFEGDHCTFSAVNPLVCPEDHYKSFYFPPTGALVRGVLWLAFGTGERNQLDFPGYTGTTQENNRFYVLKDLDPLEKTSTQTTSVARYNDFPASDYFIDAADPNKCERPEAPKVGFYIQGADSEKFVTNSVIFFGNVFTLSFIPDPNPNPCDAGGTAYLYGFDLFCGAGIFGDPSGASTDKEQKFELGDGLPNRPRVSVGPVKTELDPDCTGEDCELGCKNTVVAITSDGSAFSAAPNNDCPSGIHVGSWRDF